MTHSPEPWWWGSLLHCHDICKNKHFPYYRSIPWSGEDESPEGLMLFSGTEIPGTVRKLGEFATVLKSACVDYGGETDVAISTKDMQRIVACVNACNGISTELLEQVTRSEALVVLGGNRQIRELAERLQSQAGDLVVLEYCPACHRPLPPFAMKPPETPP